MPRLTTNVHWQDPGESLAGFVTAPTTDASLSATHLVNLYCEGESGALNAVQARTCETMRTSRSVATDKGRNEVSLLAAVGHQDRNLEIPDFDRTPLTDRSTRDIAGLELGRPLPLLFDILAAGRGVDTSHLIFTNSDICVQPYFYSFVFAALSSGHDSLIINRKTVPLDALGQLSAVGAASPGQLHPGLDCFIFPVSWLDEFQTNTACVGAGFVMRGLLHNLVALADNLLVIADANLTFHYGDDRPWNAESMQPFSDHNEREDLGVYNALCADPSRAALIQAFHLVRPKYIPRNL